MPHRIIGVSDLAWLHLIAAVCWVVGTILVAFALIVAPGCPDDEPHHRGAKVTLEQRLFLAESCEPDGQHREAPPATEAEHRYLEKHQRACDEIRRVAEAAVKKVVGKYHPDKPPE